MRHSCKLIALLVYLIVWHTTETYKVPCDHINPFTNKVLVHCPNPKAHVRENLVPHMRAAFSPAEANHFIGCLEKRNLYVTVTFETSDEIFYHSIGTFPSTFSYSGQSKFNGYYLLTTGQLVDPYDVSFGLGHSLKVNSIDGQVTIQRDGDPDPCDIK